MNQFHNDHYLSGSLVGIKHWRFNPESIGIVTGKKKYDGYEISGISVSEDINKKKYPRRNLKVLDVKSIKQADFIYYVYHNHVLYYFFQDQLRNINE